MGAKKIILILTLAVFTATLISHGLNLWHYPVFEGDEGVYTAQGWWLVNFAKITPYSYWYDHSPFGWLQIGLFQKMSGGPFTFGFSLYSTRIFMMIVAAATNAIIFLTAYKLTKNYFTSLLASVFFALSPLAVFFHRRVLLDNLMVFWLMFSLYFFISAKSRLLRIWLSGLFYGFAFLSKEFALVFLPVYLLMLKTHIKGSNKLYARIVFIITAFFVISFFPLLSLLKSEFLPSRYNPTRVSFLDTVVFQMGRGDNLPVWESNSMFRNSLNSWMNSDNIILVTGFICSLVLLLYWLYKKDRNAIVLSLLFFSFSLFLARGGLVHDFYIIGLLPFCALSAAYLAGLTVSAFKKYSANITKAIIALMILLSVNYIYKGSYLYTKNATNQQTAVVEFIKNNIPADTVIAVDAWALTDLRLMNNGHTPRFSQSQWFSKILLDPAVAEIQLNKDWRNIDFIIANHELFQNLRGEKTPSILKTAFERSSLLADFGPAFPSMRNTDTLESRSNDWASVYQVNSYGQ